MLNIQQNSLAKSNIISKYRNWNNSLSSQKKEKRILEAKIMITIMEFNTIRNNGVIIRKLEMHTILDIQIKHVLTVKKKAIYIIHALLMKIQIEAFIFKNI